MTTKASLSVRIDESNPQHHLFNNNGTWWLHATVHWPDHTKQRVRLSMKTRDLTVARSRRDGCLARWTDQPIDADSLVRPTVRVAESAPTGYAMAA